jgi:hypothetical protein
MTGKKLLKLFIGHRIGQPANVQFLVQVLLLGVFFIIAL